ncbi:Fatty acid-binding protein [bioreactor metagenome]|uniref:Fatty acid-binding protein n=1 Tax=bioreactor metagenome TaxID=1076179 RepID=A0A645HLH7_9ZZZZ
MGQGAPVLEAARVIHNGGSIEDAIKRADDVRRTEGAYYVVRTLEYLKKGGRIGVIEGTLGTLLQIRPVITVDDAGLFRAAAKTKGFKRAVSLMVGEIREKFAGKRIHLSAIHCENMEGAEQLAEEVRSFADVVECFVTQLCPTMSIHTGRGLLGLIAYEMA